MKIWQQFRELIVLRIKIYSSCFHYMFPMIYSKDFLSKMIRSQEACLTDGNTLHQQLGALQQKRQQTLFFNSLNVMWGN